MEFGLLVFMWCFLLLLLDFETSIVNERIKMWRKMYWICQIWHLVNKVVLIFRQRSQCLLNEFFFLRKVKSLEFYNNLSEFCHNYFYVDWLPNQPEKTSIHLITWLNWLKWLIVWDLSQIINIIAGAENYQTNLQSELQFTFK